MKSGNDSACWQTARIASVVSFAPAFLACGGGAGGCGPWRERGKPAGATGGESGCGAGHQLGRQCLGAGQRRPGVDDDGARTDPLLRGPGAAQERPGHDDAQPGAHGAGLGPLGALWLQHGLWAGQCLVRQPDETLPVERRRRGPQQRLCRHRAGAELHALPVDVRHYHPGVDQRGGGRADEVQRLPASSPHSG